MGNEICCICLDDLEQQGHVILQCKKHSLHKQCYNGLMHHAFKSNLDVRCPLCNFVIFHSPEIDEGNTISYVAYMIIVVIFLICMFMANIAEIDYDNFQNHINQDEYYRIVANV